MPEPKKEDKPAEKARKVIKTDSGELDVTELDGATVAFLEQLAKSKADTDAQLSDVRKAQVAAEEKLAAEVAERHRRDAVQKARDKFPHLKEDDVVEVLLETDVKKRERLENVLAQAEALAKSGRAMTEIGTAADVSGSDAERAYAAIEAGGAAIAKAENCTKEQGIARFLRTREGLDLNRKYLEARQ